MDEAEVQDSMTEMEASRGGGRAKSRNSGMEHC